MKKKLMRMIAGILFVCMMLGNMSVAYGAETDAKDIQTAAEGISEGTTDTEKGISEEGTGQTANPENGTEEVAPSGGDNAADAAPNTAAPDSAVNGTADAMSTGAVISGEEEKETEVLQENEQSDSIINFVYIESPYLETPGTQRIVFYFENELLADTVTLSVADDAGNQEEWQLARQEGSLYLFEKEYSGEAYTGTYHVVSLNLYKGDTEEKIILEDEGVTAEFGVNQEYAGIEELQPIEEESTDASPVGASVVTIDENGVAEAQDSIQNALNAVSADMASAGVSTYSQNSTSRSAKSGNIVVALDPGHDSTHAGAQGNGLKEEELTLKIANYCKEELEQYAGVKVYMTRTGASCPNPGSSSSGDDIGKRVNAAADAGAQIFVSFHLNSSVSSAANGAEIIVPNRNWKAEVGEKGEALAREILDELVALGLHERSIYSKPTTIGETYPDGSLSDYFSVQIYSKERGIPGIIIEHAFISNSSDANNFLKTEAGLKKLGVADATGIAQYLGLSKGYWETDNQGNKYYYENGTKALGEKLISGKWYYFDPENNGAMKTGWHDLPGKRVYYANTGEMLYGEQLIDGKWYCFEAFTGKMITGWYDLPEKRVYYADTGEMLYGQQEIDGEVYYFEPFTGAMYKSQWRTENGKQVYYLSSGKRAKGEVCIDNSWRYFDEETGEMVTGWHKFPEKTVYYSQEGKMLYGEQLINGKWYCFNSGTGAMITGWYDLPEKRVYYADTGEMLYGQQKIGGEVYYFEPFTGAMYKSQWRTENGKQVYYLSSGKRAKGEVCIDNSWRYFDEETGEMVTGWHKFPEKTVYYSQEGKMLYGEQLISGKWYCFNSGTGAMITGWYNLPEKRVYYADSGEMLYGEQLINNKWYYLELGTGKMLVNVWINGAYYGADGARVDEENVSSYKIEGTANTTVEQMVEFYEKYSPISYPASKLKVGGAPTLYSFANIYYEEATKENIRPEVAWCQTMLETGYLKFGGQVKIEQFNFAGLGATDGGAAGADFSMYGENGVRIGVRAQIQHLKAYASPTASKETLKEECVDPRFDLVSPKGCASDVIYLGQKENPDGKGWATSEGYGYHILDLIIKLLAL